MTLMFLSIAFCGQIPWIVQLFGLDINDEDNDDQQVSSEFLTADDVVFSQIFTFLLLVSVSIFLLQLS